MAKLGYMVDWSPGCKVSRWRSVYESPGCRVAELPGKQVEKGL